MWANIIGPDGLALRGIPKATIEEGRDSVIRQAKGLVDADIARIEAAKAEKRYEVSFGDAPG